MRPWPVRLLVILVVLGLSLGAVELYLRLYDPMEFRAPQARIDGDLWREMIHVSSPIAGLDYELGAHRSGYSQGANIQTNGLGMRNPELPDKTSRTFRIAVVGDSFTFGFGVDMIDTYVAALGRLLRADREIRKGRRFETLNFGVAGYSIQDEVKVVEHKALAVEPDLIILGYVLNDPEPDPIQPVHSYYAPVRWWQHLHVGRLIAYSAWRAKIEQYGDGDYYQYLHREPRAWRTVMAAFQDIGRLSRESGVPILLVVFPGGVPVPWENYPYRDLHEKVIDEGKRAGFYTLDLLPAFAGEPPMDTRVSESDDHPSIRGHKITARAIQVRLRRGDILN